MSCNFFKYLQPTPSVAFGLAGAVMMTKGLSNTAILSNEVLELRGTDYLTGFYYSNAAINFMLTLLIGKCKLRSTFTQIHPFLQAGRIWWVG